ncbi:hypothetical protein GCK32_007510 [Trichostrongylus colubriformis]|uniref:Uncharacterized protein n=1 Tax=Trichostrongylus colubriformis TaxID=6319 RepID=A0AAN8J0M1_TRICO
MGYGKISQFLKMRFCDRETSCGVIEPPPEGTSCVLLFAQGQAGLPQDEGYTFQPVIPEDEREGPKDYQNDILAVINRFRPEDEDFKPMRYNHQLEKLARQKSLQPYKEELNRFDATLTVGEKEFYFNKRRAFRKALRAVPYEACCVLLFSQGYAGLLEDQPYTFEPIIPEDEIDGLKNYQDDLLAAINKFRPGNEPPMKYNRQLEKDARNAYRKKGKTSSFGGVLNRFEASLNISAAEYNFKPRRAFRKALRTVPEDVATMFFLSTSHQIGCHANLDERARLCRCFTRNQCDK